MAGNILLTLALLSCVFSIIMYNYSRKKYSNTLILARTGFYLSTYFVFFASFILMLKIISHDYTTSYVYEYSSNELSFGLLISTFFAGQAGSFLLWCFFSAITGLILLKQVKGKEFEINVMLVFNFTLLFLLVMVNPLLKSPFASLWENITYISLEHVNPVYASLEQLQSFIAQNNNTGKYFLKIDTAFMGFLAQNNIQLSQFVINGNGLNPLLQNFWMQIHPPMLFVGFALSSVPFAFALAAFLSNSYHDWVKKVYPWHLAGSMILGLSIMLGGYWAYGILGWGGYWGWDPVENASLVPWLVWIAVLHTSYLQLKKHRENKNRFLKTNLFLSAWVFVLVVYSTFLTRSGVLQDASVHAFVAPGKIVFAVLLIFLVGFTAASLIGFFIRKKELKILQSIDENPFSKEMVLFGAAVLLLASGLIIITGTSSPLIGSSTSVDFYNNMNLPISVLILLLLGFAVFMKWGKTDLKKSINSIVLHLSIAIILTGIISVLYPTLTFGLLAIVFAAFFAFILQGYKNFQSLLTKAKIKGGYVTHLGIIIFLIGVAFSGISEKKQVKLFVNESTKIFDRDVVFTKAEANLDGYKFFINVKNGNSSSELVPIMKNNTMNGGVIAEPSFTSNMFEDFYISPVEFNPENKQSSFLSLKKGEKVNYKDMSLQFNKFEFSNMGMPAAQDSTGITVAALIDVSSGVKNISIKPLFMVKDDKKFGIPFKIEELNLTVTIEKLEASGLIELSINDGKADELKIVSANLVVDVSSNKVIAFVWLGVIIVSLGLSLTFYQRLKIKNNDE